MMSDVQRSPVSSRALISVGYDNETQTLEVEFTRGRVFQYAGVPRSTYEWLLRAPNKGGIFNRLIRDRFPEVEVTPVVEQDLLAKLRDSLTKSDD
jgi:hypothetical protein